MSGLYAGNVCGKWWGSAMRDDGFMGYRNTQGDPRHLADRKTAPFQREVGSAHRRTRPLKPARRRGGLWLALGLISAVALGVGAVFALDARPSSSAAAALSPTRGPRGAILGAPTPSATPHVVGTSGPIPPINLGCSVGSLQPYSSVVRAGASAHEIAITFDDGPSPDYTASMMTTLEQTHTLATFFVVGSNADKYPALIKRAAADGFGIGMHTYYHPYMTQLSPADRAWEIGETANAIHRALGPNYCLPYWRPPFGDWNGDVFSQMSAAGLTSITWDNDPADWSSPGVQTIVDRIVAAIHGGSIILCHDGYNFRSQTNQALPQIISKLKAMGYVFVTIPQLLGLPQPHAEPATSSSSTPTPSSSPSPTATAPASTSPTALRPSWIA
jgi:peptidoglycan/xylan/chitin deacetylase (PgdA/CDA1 family)